MTLNRNIPKEWDQILDEYEKHLVNSKLAPMARRMLVDPLDRNRYIATIELLGERLKQPGASILDVAASPFLLDMYLATHFRCKSLVATDLAPENLKLDWAAAEKTITVRKWDLETEDPPQDLRQIAPFDAVLFLEIFEHLRLDPISVMKHIISLVAPGGFLLVSVPNIYFWKKFAQVLAGRGISDTYRTYDMLRTHGFVGHVRMPCVVEMRTFFERLGHNIEGIYGLVGSRFRPVRTPYALFSSHIALVIRPGEPSNSQ